MFRRLFRCYTYTVARDRRWRERAEERYGAPDDNGESGIFHKVDIQGSLQPRVRGFLYAGIMNDVL